MIVAWIRSIIMFFSWSVWRRALVRTSEAGLFQQTAALSFLTLLAVVPILAAFVMVLIHTPMFKDLTSQVEVWLLKHLLQHDAEALTQHIAVFIRQGQSFGFLGFVYLLSSGVFLLSSMEIALNAIWKSKEQRHNMLALLLYGFVLLLVPMFFALALAVNNGLAEFTWLTKAPVWLRTLYQVLTFGPGMVIWLLIVGIYKYIPNANVSWRSAIISSIFASALLEITKNMLSLYFSQFTGYKTLYGSMVVIPMFMIWVYMAWFVLLWCALWSESVQMISHQQYIREQS